MVIHIEENLEMEREMDKEFTLITMEINIKESGWMMLKMDKENINIIPVESGIRDNGKIILRMDRENIYSIMEINIWDNFRME